MSTVYRAWSPSRGWGTSVTDLPGDAATHAATNNQHCAVDGGQADWVVQAGTVQWEDPQ